MKNVAIVGHTGVVGARVVQHLLSSEGAGRVLCLGRNPPAQQHERLTFQAVDVKSAPALRSVLPDGLDVAICCLGTTLKKAGSQPAFRAIDHDAVLAFGEAARSKGAARFLIVSSVGADPSAGSFYLRTKGEAEAGLTQLGFPQLVILRPSLIDDQGARSDRRLGEQLALPLTRALFAIIGKTHRYAPISADTIARALVRLALDEPAEPVRIVEGERLHALGG